MSNEKVTVPRQFVTDFEAVAKHYKLRERGEYELAKQTARNDMDSAIQCFAELAKDIAA